jgi:signal transduction histidine kinase
MKSSIMKSLGITKRSIIVLIIVFAIVSGIIFAIMEILDRWTKDIVNTNTNLTEQSVKKILSASTPVLDSLWDKKFFTRTELSLREHKTIDSIFGSITALQVISIEGMEGGFYLSNVDEMIGYSWPSAPPPPPAYGPAPRSYPIIKEQVIRTYKQNSAFTEFHSFDFAVFPLASVPLETHGTIVGSVWARIHVERQLPSKRLADALNIGAIIAIGALGATLLLLVIRKRHIDAIRRGLDRLRLDPSHRLEESKGVYGVIASSINSMVEAMAFEQQRREQLEQELHQQDKMATLGKLIAGVSHEVKTPLAIIKTRIQMWQRDMIELGAETPTEKIVSKDSMELVIREIDRLSRLVKRLLVFSKPVTTRVQKQDVNSLVAQTLAFVQTGIHEKNISVTTNYDQSLPSLLIDPQGIEQVLLNVLMNSIDAIGDGDSITVSTFYKKEKQIAEIIIKDSGEGIPSEALQRVFDPFFTTKQQGVGLGLSISYEIIKAHGGTIEFLAPGERGTICKITLPCK